MSDKKPAYHIGFALSDARIAPLNTDGTYGESVPLPEVSGLYVAAKVPPDENISFSTADMIKSFTWTFAGSWPLIAMHSRKVQHAIARRRARALARQRGGA